MNSPPLWPWLCRLFDDTRFAKTHPGWREVAQKCALFDLRDAGDITNEPRIESAEEFAQLHAPPFPLCGFLYGDVCLLIRNPVVEAAGDNISCGAEVFGMLRMWNERMLKDGRECDPLVTKICAFVSGTAHVRADEGQVFPTARSYSIGPKYNSRLAKEKPEKAEEIFSEFGTDTCLGVLLHCLRYINAPQHFVVRDAPAKVRRAKGNTIPRLGQRPRYILLDKQTIGVRYRAAERAAGRQSPVPHLRRGHYRTLTAERFGENRGHG